MRVGVTVRFCVCLCACLPMCSLLNLRVHEAEGGPSLYKREWACERLLRLRVRVACVPVTKAFTFAACHSQQLLQGLLEGRAGRSRALLMTKPRKAEKSVEMRSPHGTPL